MKNKMIRKYESKRIDSVRAQLTVRHFSVGYLLWFDEEFFDVPTQTYDISNTAASSRY